jgi:uroporphyrinogen decarboxylase
MAGRDCACAERLTVDGREIVRRAIEFRNPPRLPFFQTETTEAPDDVFACVEMDRARRGWFFHEGGEDDWGCGWRVLGDQSMGQVAHHPLADWNDLEAYTPPDPRDPFYYERIDACLGQAQGRYVMVTSHFNLMERLHMLHGFTETFEDFYLAPDRIERVLDIILEFKIAQFDELGRRYGDGIDGIFMTDDWGTQTGPYVSSDVYESLFHARYTRLFDAVHAQGWHVILHSDGRINDLIPRFIDAGADVLNLLQPRLVGIEEIGARFAGKIAFLTAPDIQQTLPSGDADAIGAEALELVEHWSRPEGGLIVATCGDGTLLGMQPGMHLEMFRAFAGLQHYWQTLRP